MKVEKKILNPPEVTDTFIYRSVENKRVTYIDMIVSEVFPNGDIEIMDQHGNIKIISKD